MKKIKNLTEVQCHRCKHKWNYKGKKINSKNNYAQFVSCPKCRTTTKLIKCVLKK